MSSRSAQQNLQDLCDLLQQQAPNTFTQQSRIHTSQNTNTNHSLPTSKHLIGTAHSRRAAANLPLPSKLELVAEKVLQSRGNYLDTSALPVSPLELTSPAEICGNNFPFPHNARPADMLTPPESNGKNTRKQSPKQVPATLTENSNTEELSQSSSEASDDSIMSASTSELLRRVAEVLESEKGEKIMSAVRSLKAKQDNKERELYELRTQFYDRIRVNVHAEIPATSAISSSQEEHSYDSSQNAPPTPTSPLMQFDTNILDQLDAVMEEQQRVLQALGVPGFFVTREPKIVERQRVVVEVMRGVGLGQSIKT